MYVIIILRVNPPVKGCPGNDENIGFETRNTLGVEKKTTLIQNNKFVDWTTAVKLDGVKGEEAAENKFIGNIVNVKVGN